jgi:hypothetical protein
MAERQKLARKPYLFLPEVRDIDADLRTMQQPEQTQAAPSNEQIISPRRRGLGKAANSQEGKSLRDMPRAPRRIPTPAIRIR